MTPILENEPKRIENPITLIIGIASGTLKNSAAWGL